MQGPPQALYRK